MRVSGAGSSRASCSCWVSTRGSGGDRDELFAAWRTFFERVSEQGTVVLVFEDLQWADTGLLDFIDHLVEWSRGRPILVMTMARPELLERRPAWGAGRRNFVSLSLEPLTRDDMAMLLDGLVPGLPDAMVGAILDRADGIPLYAVETIRMLLHDGQLEAVDGIYRPVSDEIRLDVPETLHALIAARLDGLDAADRSLLQDAAVLGQTFSVGALAAVCGQEPEAVTANLRSLERRELVAEEIDPRSPERGQWSFVQALIREVGYATLSKRDRRARHLSAARYVEGLGDDELAGVQALHYRDAYLAMPDGPEGEAVAVQARLALRGAAERASALHSNDLALTYLEQALSISPDSAEDPELLERAGNAAFEAGRHDAAETHLTHAIERYRAVGERVGVAPRDGRARCFVRQQQPGRSRHRHIAGGHRGISGARGPAGDGLGRCAAGAGIHAPRGAAGGPRMGRTDARRGGAARHGGRGRRGHEHQGARAPDPRPVHRSDDDPARGPVVGRAERPHPG